MSGSRNAVLAESITYSVALDLLREAVHDQLHVLLYVAMPEDAAPDGVDFLAQAVDGADCRVVVFGDPMLYEATGVEAKLVQGRGAAAWLQEYLVPGLHALNAVTGGGLRMQAMALVRKSDAAALHRVERNLGRALAPGQDLVALVPPWVEQRGTAIPHVPGALLFVMAEVDEGARASLEELQERLGAHGA